MTEKEREVAEHKIMEMSREGLRVIAIGMMKPKTEVDIPAQIFSMDYSWKAQLPF